MAKTQIKCLMCDAEISTAGLANGTRYGFCKEHWALGFGLRKVASRWNVVCPGGGTIPATTVKGGKEVQMILNMTPAAP